MQTLRSVGLCSLEGRAYGSSTITGSKSSTPAFVVPPALRRPAKGERGDANALRGRQGCDNLPYLARRPLISIFTVCSHIAGRSHVRFRSDDGYLAHGSPRSRFRLRERRSPCDRAPCGGERAHRGGSKRCVGLERPPASMSSRDAGELRADMTQLHEITNWLGAHAGGRPPLSAELKEAEAWLGEIAGTIGEAEEALLAA
jgi:hypothetical protein